MKITFVLRAADWGGGCRVIATYAHLLMQRGHEVVVVYRPPTPTLRHYLSLAVSKFFSSAIGEDAQSHLDVLNIPQIQLPSDRTVTDADIPDADVVIATYWRTAREVLELSPRKGAKAYFIQGFEVVCIGVHQDEVKETWTYPMRKIVVAPWLKEIAELEFEDSTAILVPNGVSMEQFTALPRQKCARPTIGFIFSQLEFKGADLVIKAVEMLRRDIPDLRLVSFGTSWRKRLRNGLSLPKGTEYYVLPPQNKIPGIYAECDAWVCASRSEGFGLPILESMACRTPVISTPTGIAPLLAKQGGLRLVPHEDPESLACEIRHILELPNQDWAELSSLAYTTARRFNVEESARQFEKALEVVVASSGSQAPSLSNVASCIGD